MQEVFPEYLSGVGVDTLTPLYLLDKYLLPGDFTRMSIREEEQQVRRISNGTHTLAALKALAEKSIGAHVEEAAELRLTLDAWSMQLRQIDQSLKKVASAMIELAKKTEYFGILTSLQGISAITAARFIAECRDLNDYRHYKQIEKLAGANLRARDSGTYEGTRRISKLGNKRLLRLIYLMTTQVVKFIPEVRSTFLRRQLTKKCYRKNIVACIPWLLKLIMALVREKRPYVFRELPEDLKKLEAKYMDMRNSDRKMREAA
jgi:transposase